MDLTWNCISRPYMGGMSISGDSGPGWGGITPTGGPSWNRRPRRECDLRAGAGRRGDFPIGLPPGTGAVAMDARCAPGQGAISAPDIPGRPTPMDGIVVASNRVVPTVAWIADDWDPAKIAICGDKPDLADHFERTNRHQGRLPSATFYRQRRTRYRLGYQMRYFGIVSDILHL